MVSFNDNVFGKIINNLITSKCEIDPMSVRYGAVINLYKYLEKEDKDKLQIIEKILREKFQNIDGDLLKFLESRIFDLNTRIYSLERVKELYKLNNSDFEKGNFTVEYNYYNSYYKKEEILTYLYENYGQEKVDQRRLNSEKKSEQMKKMMKEKSEKRENFKEDRKQEVLGLLEEAGLFYTRGLYIADNYIENGGELNVDEMLKKASDIIKREREIEKRKEALYEQLEKYGCKDLKKERICLHYYTGNVNVSLEEFVDHIRELKWLRTEAEYENYLRQHLSIERYDSLLGKYICIRSFRQISKIETGRDKVKTFVVEKYLDKKNWDLELVGIVPPNIEKRINEIFDKKERNDKIVADLEKEREEKREELRKQELARKEAIKERRREKAKLDREKKKQEKVVKEA